MTTEPRLRELEDALAAGPTPGPWDWDVLEDVPELFIPRDRPRRSMSIWSRRAAQDARYIAAASPDVIRALLEERADFKDTLARLTEFVGDTDPALIDAFVFTENVRRRALSDTPQEATSDE